MGFSDVAFAEANAVVNRYDNENISRAIGKCEACQTSAQIRKPLTATTSGLARRRGHQSKHDDQTKDNVAKLQVAGVLPGTRRGGGVRRTGPQDN